MPATAEDEQQGQDQQQHDGQDSTTERRLGKTGNQKRTAQRHPHPVRARPPQAGDQDHQAAQHPRQQTAGGTARPHPARHHRQLHLQMTARRQVYRPHDFNAIATAPSVRQGVLQRPLRTQQGPYHRPGLGHHGRQTTGAARVAAILRTGRSGHGVALWRGDPPTHKGGMGIRHHRRHQRHATDTRVPEPGCAVRQGIDHFNLQGGVRIAQPPHRHQHNVAVALRKHILPATLFIHELDGP